jgi:hypothetical protein
MRQWQLVFPSVLILLMLLAGCQSDPGGTTGRLRNEGRTPAYIEGYQDGCKSGYFAAGDSSYKFARDATRFNYDAQYVNGWNGGFSACKAQRPGSAG